MGTLARPQYQERMVNMSTDAGNAAGKANRSKILFREG